MSTRSDAFEAAELIGPSVTHIVCQDGGLVLDRDPAATAAAGEAAGGFDGWRSSIVNLYTYKDALRLPL